MRLGLIPHRGETLASMTSSGQLQRFVRYYLRSYAETFSAVDYFTYASRADELTASDVENLVEIRHKPSGVRNVVYSFLMPFAQRAHLRRCDVLRVYQTPGVFPAALARLLYRVPFVVTYGYRYDEFARLRGARSEVMFAKAAERVAFRSAAAIIVTTEELYDYVARRVPRERIHLIPNGVDTDAFSPAASPPAEQRVAYVGSLVARKNVAALIEAIAALPGDVALDIAGEGPERSSLEALARRLGIRVTFHGSLPHGALPHLLRGATIFALPSLAEGHPKALLEAMSCGLPCVAARAKGSAGVIRDGENGLLAEPDQTSLGKAIERLTGDTSLRLELGRRARADAVERFGIRRTLELELSLLARMGRR